MLNPYLTFKDQAREAMEFYKSIIGGELKIMTFGEGMPQGHEDAAEKDLVMHADLNNGTINFFASDGGANHPVDVGNNMSMSLSGDDDETLTKYFEGLSADGKVTMPLEKAPWGDKFGMFTDKFGINWMVNISSGQSPATQQ
jgi:PhnB protein